MADELPEHVLRTRAAWDVLAAEYAEPGRRSWAADEPSWGIFGVPEADLPGLAEATATRAGNLANPKQASAPEIRGLFESIW